MRYRNPVRSFTRGISGAIVLVGLVFAFIGGGFNLPIFFFFLAISIIVGSLGTLNPRAIYGSLIGAMWMLILALFFLTHWWVLFLIGAALSAILGTLMRPLLAMLAGMGLFAMMNNRPPQQPYYQPQQPQQPHYQPQQPYYQPPTQDPPSSYTPYQQGYQPPQQSYQEGGQPHQYPEQSAPYDQPQAQYPQQIPPQQQ